MAEPTQADLEAMTKKLAGLEAATVDIWLLLAGVIVFFMQTGFALLEAGTVRFKNYQNILLKNCMDACIGGLVWWACGYAFAFGNVDGGFIGKQYFFANGDDMDYTMWFFQFAFACTAATIVSGSLAERVQINTYLLFSFFCTGFIYPVVVAWTWGGGWLTASDAEGNAYWGYKDFAGSGIVHLVGGVAGLVGAIVAGPRVGRFPETDAELVAQTDRQEIDPSPNTARRAANTIQSNPNGYADVIAKYDKGDWDINRVHEFIRMYACKLQEKEIAPHSPQQCVMGTLILWLGWLMFNGGSSAAVVGDGGASAKLAIINTIISPSAAGIFTFMTKKYITGEEKTMRMDFPALTNGILAGLVGITAACDCVAPWAAFVTGILASLTYSLSCRAMNALKIDDPLDATQVHGCCGILGVLIVAFFDQQNGLLYGAEGAGKLLGAQCLGIVCIIAWVATTSGIFFFAANKLNVLRLHKNDEVLGGDLYYFGPIKFEGQINQYDLPEQVEQAILKSPWRKTEGDVELVDV